MLDETQIDNLIFNILESFNLAMAFEGIDAGTRHRILLAVEDGIVNNAFEEN